MGRGARSFSGSTIALNGLTDVTGTSTLGLPLVRQSSAYGFAALGSGGIADGAVATSKLPAKAVTLAKISAGDSTTSGHVLTVSGSTGDVTAAALPDIDIEAVFGIPASPEAGNIIKRNTANTAWVYAPDATGGGGGGGSGIALTDLSASGIVDFDNTTGAFSTDTAELADAIDGILEDSGSITITKSGNTITLSVPAIPSKAGAAELREGTDDSRFVTPAGVASMDQTAAAGVTWALTYDTTGALAQGQVRENATAYQYTIKATNSVETDMDQRFHRGAKIRLERDASNYVRGRVQWADKGEGDQSDEFVVQVASEGRSVAGDIKVDGASVNVYAEGALWPGLHDDGEFVVYDDITAGTGITKGARQADGTFTISASGAIAKADKPTALAGTDDTKFMTPLRVHDVVDHLGHVADYTGMQYTTSQAGEMAVGTWNINASGTRAWFRGHTQAQAEEMAREFLIDRYFILGRNGQTIEAQFTDVTSIAVSGSSVGVVQCDIQDHDANPDNPTLTVGDDWDLALLSPQAMELFRHIPHAVITGNSIKTGAVGVAQLRGQVQECRMFMNNDGSGSRNQNITASASTDFGTGTLTTVSANVKSWAIGGGTNTGEHFDQKDGFTLLGNASPDFCEFRAEDGWGLFRSDGRHRGVLHARGQQRHAPGRRPRGGAGVCRKGAGIERLVGMGALRQHRHQPHHQRGQHAGLRRVGFLRLEQLPVGAEQVGVPHQGLHPAHRRRRQHFLRCRAAVLCVVHSGPHRRGLPRQQPRLSVQVRVQRAATQRQLGWPRVDTAHIQLHRADAGEPPGLERIEPCNRKAQHRSRPARSTSSSRRPRGPHRYQGDATRRRQT